jgi:hypothetical protein
MWSYINVNSVHVLSWRRCARLPDGLLFLAACKARCACHYPSSTSDSFDHSIV